MQSIRTVLLILVTFFVPLTLGGCGGKIDQEMSNFEARLDQVDSLETRTVLSPEEAKQEREQILAAAAKINKAPITQEQIRSWDQGSSIFTMKNILLVLAGLLLVIGLVAVCATHFLNFFVRLPREVYEGVAYVVALGLAFSHVAPGLNFVGCLLFYVATQLTYVFRFTKGESFREGVKTKSTGVLWACLAVWSAAAILHESSLIGFLSAGAACRLIGFSFLASPGCFAFGFETDKQMPRATVAALFLTAAGVILSAMGETAPHWALPFTSGLLFVGTFVYFLGLLILSSSLYTKESGSYWALQVVTAGSLLAAIYVGKRYNIELLVGISGTFGVFWAIEKWLELTMKAMRSWSLAVLGTGALLYGAYYMLERYPQYFLF